MSHRPSRIIVIPLRQAWPWRWEMALLEEGSRGSWRLPAADLLALRARQIGEALQSDAARSALAFEGYTLMGACWGSVDLSAGTAKLVIPAFGPYVMPGAAGSGLSTRLLEALSGPSPQVRCSTSQP